MLKNIAHCIVARNPDCVNKFLGSSLQETHIVLTCFLLHRCKRPTLY